MIADLRRRLDAYPWDAVLFSMLLVVLIVVLGSFAVDAGWTAQWNLLGRPAAGEFRGTCYWMGDARILIRIAGSGYSDYNVNLTLRHLTILPDRSWWPVYIHLTALMLRLTGGSYCAGWLVNVIAMALLPPVIQGITGTRRPLLMTGIALMPFGSWLYSGMADATFLLVSGLLLWLALRGPTGGGRRAVIAGVGALLIGVIVGLTKPNALTLLPGFAVLALVRTVEHVRRAAPAPRSWRAIVRLTLSDANPGWTAALGTLGMLAGVGLWVYQTSGFYPLYVIMAQRTLWFKEFDGGSPLAFLSYISEGLWMFFNGRGLPDPTPETMMHLAALVLMAVLLVRDLPPRQQAAAPPKRLPLYAAASMLAIFGLMFNTGQAHSVERYFLLNIFFTIAYLRYVYGDEDEPPLAALPGKLRPWGPESLRALLRLLMFACGPLLLILESAVMIIYGI